MTLRGAVREALERGAAALEAVSTPELLLASEQELRPVDSPYTAALVLSALASVPEPLRRAAPPLRRYLLESREPSGLWRLWEPSPELPPSTSTSARALLALELWQVEDVPSAELLQRLLASLRQDGARGTWDGTPPAPGEQEVDVLASVEVLALATRLGRAPEALTAFVGGRLEATGLEGHPRHPFHTSPFFFAHALAHWLSLYPDAHALRRLVWRDCARRREAAMSNPLDCALMLSTFFRIGPPPGEPAWEQRLADMVSRVLQEQSDIGLWPALPLLTGPTGLVHGSLQVSTALCLEALALYLQRSEASGLSAAEEPSTGLLRGRRASAARRERAPDARPRPGTWGHTLEALDGMLPPALVSPEALSNIRSIAHWLPAALTDGFGIECRLAEPTPLADVYFWVNSDGFGRDILAGGDPHVTLAPELLREPLWRSIRAFSRQWAEPGSLLYQGVDSFWLEFDVGPRPLERPLPVLFFCPEEVPIPEERARAREVRAHHQAISTTALQLLGDGTLSSETLRQVDACIEALPAGAQPFAIGVMRSRQLDTVRFCAKGIPGERLVEYLSSIGWSGPRPELQALLDWLIPYVDRFVLDFDVGSHVLPSVGLECSFQGRRQPHAEPRWATLLGELVRRGLCLGDKRDALLEWPGLSTYVERNGRETRESRFDRRLSHLKLSLKPELEVKGYVGAWRYFEAKLET